MWWLLFTVMVTSDHRQKLFVFPLRETQTQHCKSPAGCLTTLTYLFWWHSKDCPVLLWKYSVSCKVIPEIIVFVTLLLYVMRLCVFVMLVMLLWLLSLLFFVFFLSPLMSWSLQQIYSCKDTFLFSPLLSGWSKPDLARCSFSALMNPTCSRVDVIVSINNTSKCVHL